MWETNFRIFFNHRIELFGEEDTQEAYIYILNQNTYENSEDTFKSM